MSESRKALTLLTTVNYLNYIDRYILAAVLTSIQADLLLSDMQAGLLASAFMVAYMFAAPFFGWLGDNRPRNRILAFGIALWSLATALTGLARGFVTVAASRFLLGVGESAFTTVSIPFLSEHFSEGRKGRALAIFSSAIPVGAALGYVLGGLLGESFGWRAAFFIVGLPGVFLAYFVYSLKDPRHRHTHEGQIRVREMLSLFKVKPYMVGVFGYCAYVFVLGGVAHWIPSYMQRMFEVTQLQANTTFGGIAVVSGLVGTLVGGYIGDWMRVKSRGGNYLFCSITMLLAIPCFYFTVATSDYQTFLVWLVLTQFLFFSSTGPFNVAVLESAPKRLQTTSVALSILMSHILGDAISSPLIGYVSDKTGSLQQGVMICTPMIAISAAIWFWAAKVESKTEF